MNIQKVISNQIFIYILVGLIVLAWISMFFQPNENHHENNEIFFVTSWTLMTVAMMLPSILPLIFMFKSMVIEKNNGILLIFLLIFGYLNIWIIFGIIANVFINWYIGLSINFFMENTENYIKPIVIIIAGLYQFSSLKYYCLDKCRSPRNFIIKHWQGRNEKLQAFILGVDHGIFCVGCCWSLIFIIFLVGIGNISWMIILAVIMSMEKNISILQDKFFSSLIGICLIFYGIYSSIQFNLR